MGYLLEAIGPSAVAILNGGSKYQNYKMNRGHEKLIPYIELTAGGRVKSLESFGAYVVRQLGFSQPDDCSRLSKVAEDYLRGDKSSSDQSQENIVAYLSSVYPEEEIESLQKELICELDGCMLSYFAFHWQHSPFVINQILHGNSTSKNKLRAAVLSATRKQRFERVMKTLRTKNLFSTLVEQMKTIGHQSNNESNVVVPADVNMRSPVLLLIGGGMGVGKSTVIKDILRDSFWSGAADNAVMVEADAFKEMDLVYQALNLHGVDDMLETAELVHKSSIDAASSLLVTALNEGRDVIFDGTMSWEPFVLQTIAMARDVHCRRYRMGPGYQIGDDYAVQEKYWEPVEDSDFLEGIEVAEKITENKGGDLSNEATGMPTTRKSLVKIRKPYRIQLVGVVCDAHLAVVRGMRRAIITRRAVRIKEQLKSHKRFAVAFPRYCEMVDHVRLYCTNAIGGPAELIGRKEGNQKLLLDPEAIKAVSKLSFLNEDAQSVYELYNSLKDGNKLDKVWKDVVLSSERESRQNYLQIAIQRIESSLLKKTTSDLNSSSFSSSSFSSSNFSRQSSSDSFSDFSWQSSISGPEQNNDGTEIDSSANPDYPKEADSCIHSIISDCSVCTVDSIMYNYS